MSNLLQVITNLDLRIFIGFLTLQLVLGGYISQPNFIVYNKYLFLLMDGLLTIVCSVLLIKNKRRRVEVMETIKNCNKALGYEKEGIYLEEPLNAKTKGRSLLWLYLIGNAISFSGIAFVLFFGYPEKMKEASSSTLTPNVKTEIPTP